MTRFQRSSLDYAIACLARGQRPESLSHLTEIVGGDAYSRAIDLVAAEVARQRVGRKVCPIGTDFAHARRIVRARLALYLRLVRRTEAWERYERPFHEQCRPDPRVTWARIVWRPDTWRPLWLDAPHHEPGMTARRRRERRCEEK